MPPSSPVAALYQVLQRVHASATAHAGLFQKNEAATRAALIDPVLRALGWDTGNVRMVEPEKSLGNELRVDYLLNDAAGRPYVVIEAKCLGSSLDKYGYVGKILGYALTLNVQTVCITDGLQWHIHSNLQSGKSEPITFTLSESSFLLAANQLIQWLDAAQSGHGLAPAVASVHNSSQPVVPTNKPATPVAKPIQKPKPHKPPVTGFVDVSKLHLLDLPPGQKPKLLRLPNGVIKPISIWKDILLEVCYLVLDANPNLSLPLPDKAGKKRFLLSSTKPALGSSTQAKYQGKPVFIGTHYSAADCIANALYAAAQLPAHQQATTLAVSF